MPNIEYRGHVTLNPTHHDHVFTIGNRINLSECNVKTGAMQTCNAPNPNWIPLQPTCRECGRVFDLCDTTDVEEWTHGHDCEN